MEEQMFELAISELSVFVVTYFFLMWLLLGGSEKTLPNNKLDELRQRFGFWADKYGGFVSLLLLPILAFLFTKGIAWVFS